MHGTVLWRLDWRAGASVASFLFDRGSVALGASGAVFGLFAVAVLLKLRFSFQKLVEGLVLGQFVVKQVLQVSSLRSLLASCSTIFQHAARTL